MINLNKNKMIYDTQEKRAVFIDRDGVICFDKDLMYKKEDLELVSRAGEAIKLLNDSGYLTIVITNQPVVARGLCTITELEDMNRHLEKILQQHGAKLDKIYCCQHHPNPKGKIGENGVNKEYAVDCKCRKPKPGMILQAQKDFNILNLSECYMIGDSISDIKAGHDAGCKTILIKTGKEDPYQDAVPDFTTTDLYNAVKDIVLKRV